MESRTLISVEEYLRQYRPGREYLDGVMQERNLADRDPTAVMRLNSFFSAAAKRWAITVSAEQRLNLSRSRQRVTDFCVMLGVTEEGTFMRIPFLCVDIVSLEDRMIAVRSRVNDYLQLGVPHVWVLDPQHKAAYSITPAEGWREEKQSLRTADPALEMPLSAIFA